MAAKLSWNETSRTTSGSQPVMIAAASAIDGRALVGRPASVAPT